MVIIHDQWIELTHTRALKSCSHDEIWKYKRSLTDVYYLELRKQLSEPTMGGLFPQDCICEWLLLIIPVSKFAK